MAEIPRSALIVDDERDIRELLVLTLGRMGLRTETAATLAAANALLASERFDLCLTDMRLPDGSGMTLVQELAARYPDTPVAMITAHGNQEAAVEALKAGAFDFVSKPVDINVLRRLVRQALELGERRREDAANNRRRHGLDGRDWSRGQRGQRRRERGDQDAGKRGCGRKAKHGFSPGAPRSRDAPSPHAGRARVNECPGKT